MTTVKEFCQSVVDDKWAGDDRFPVKLGDVGFVLRLTHYVNGKPRSRVELRAHPAKEARTYYEVLYGSIDGGQTDVDALGVAEVSEVTHNGRGRLKSLWGEQAQDALKRLGYPGLGEQLALGDGPWRD